MTTDALLFARVVARVASYYIINTTKCATAACCSTHAPDADDIVNLAALLRDYILRIDMRLFTRQRRELNDDRCDILLSYYDN